MLRLFRASRAVQSKVPTRTFRPFDHGRSHRARLHVSTLALPYAVGCGLVLLGYECLTRDSLELFRKAYAEPPEYHNYKAAYRAFVETVKAGISVGRLEVDEEDGAETPLSRANAFLRVLSQSMVHDWGRVDTCAVPSNSRLGEDRFGLLDNTENRKEGQERMFSFGIYDGHAGHSTADILAGVLGVIVLNNIATLESCDIPNKFGAKADILDVETSIKTSFLFLDAIIMGIAEADLENLSLPLGSATATHDLAPALSGSCALFAMFEPATSALWVANVGDSRAVLGRADSLGDYSPTPLSNDHTGFNPSEVARITAEHPPDEKIIDEKTGRVHGIAVSRAFGDARWKWTDEMIKDAQKRFWGHGPRPGGVIRTPPYLTAEPEVTQLTVDSNRKYPAFMIMASDGFWDCMSNEDAVLCVQRWMEAKKDGRLACFDQRIGDAELRAEKAKGSSLDQDVYYNEEHDGAMEWRIKPEHFVVEDDNCATHLMKNVLGGKRRSLFCGLLNLSPPLSRDVRDDITIHVVFFGDV